MSSRSFISIVALLAVAHITLGAIGPVGDMIITDQTVAPDGFSRLGAVANGVAAGLLVRGKKGDNFRINVINNLDNSTILQSTSIHWHGLFQRGTTWADGPAFISQCPIARTNSFLYNFVADNQAGTFWWHSHLSTQYCDGLRGPLVIYDPADPHASLYTVDDESTVITLADWYHDPAKSLTFPTPQSTLINGKGRWNSTQQTDLSVITVRKGTRYRMRLVNMGCDPSYDFSIDGHNMTIIEVDGISHRQLTVDQLTIFAGQRYSFILDANQNVGNYWIRANPSLGTGGYENGINSAILRYVGAPVADPPVLTVSPSAILNEANLVPLTRPGAPGRPVAGGVDVAINLAIAFTSAATFAINGASYTPPSLPVLLQILSGAQTPGSLLPSGSIFELPLNSTVEISIPGGGSHPFHLHHSFDVVRTAGSTVYNYINPPRRDVVSIGAAGDNVTFRFVTDNAGPWFLHCHIDWHLEVGLAVVFAEGADIWDTNINPSDQWDDLCPIYRALPADQL